MAINRLYISHRQYNWSGNFSKLLNSKNLNKILSDELFDDYHTSIEDVQFENIQKIIESAVSIVIVDIDLNFLNKITDNVYEWGHLFYLLLQHNKKVSGFDWIDQFNYTKFNTTLNSRHSDQPTLWAAGCSFTKGDGIKPNEVYANLLAQKLNMPFVNLGESGVSIAFAVDQILRSDIRKNDIVVLSITAISRFLYTEEWNLRSLPCSNHKNLKPVHTSLEYFDSQLHVTLCVKQILEAINFCERIGAKIYIVNFLDPSWIPVIFKNYPGFVDFCKGYDYNTKPFAFVDLGTDDMHPGPRQHQIWGDKLYDLIRKN